MANEISMSLSCSIQKRVGNVLVVNEKWSESYRADLEGQRGPSPGLVSATLIGVAVDLSKLTTPGFCKLFNQGSGDQTTDQTCYVEVGIYDQTAAVNRFYPLLELYPGECQIVRLSRFLGQEFGTALSGTATSLGTDNKLFVKAVGAVQNVTFQAMER